MFSRTSFLLLFWARCRRCRKSLRLSVFKEGKVQNFPMGLYYLLSLYIIDWLYLIITKNIEQLFNIANTCWRRRQRVQEKCAPFSLLNIYTSKIYRLDHSSNSILEEIFFFNTSEKLHNMEVFFRFVEFSRGIEDVM